MTKSQISLKFNDFYDLIVVICMIIITVLAPMTLFLLFSSWFDSFDVHSHNINIIKTHNFQQTSVIYGFIGLLIGLFFVTILFYFEYKFKSSYQKPKYYLFIILVALVPTFCGLEITSLTVMNFYFTSKLLTVLIFLPITYIFIVLLVVANYYHNLQYCNFVISKANNDEIIITKDPTLTIF